MNINKLAEIKVSKQLFRYIVTGGAAFVAEYALYQLLYRILGVDYAVAAVIVYTLLFIITFVVTRKWTFESTGSAAAQLVMHFLLFAFNVWVGNYLLMRGLVGVGISKDIAPFLKTAMITCWNFLIYKFIIYKN